MPLFQASWPHNVVPMKTLLTQNTGESQARSHVKAFQNLHLLQLYPCPKPKQYVFTNSDVCMHLMACGLVGLKNNVNKTENIKYCRGSLPGFPSVTPWPSHCKTQGGSTLSPVNLKFLNEEILMIVRLALQMTTVISSHPRPNSLANWENESSKYLLGPILVDFYVVFEPAEAALCWSEVCFGSDFHRPSLSASHVGWGWSSNWSKKESGSSTTERYEKKTIYK